MAERSAIAQVVQVGVESTAGTNVAADKQWLSIGIEPGVKVDMQRFKPMGQKYPSIIIPGKEWVEAKIAGIGSYTELAYVFASLLLNPGAAVTSDTTAKKYTYTPSNSTEDTPMTFTVEQGSATRAQKFNYGLINELELDFSRSGVDVKGAMIGQRLSDGITLTGSPTTLAQEPILPTDLDVYLDTTSGGLGGTKLTRVLKANWKMSNRWGSLWPLNSANTSFATHVETEPKAEIKLLVEADSTGMAFLTQMRAGTTKYLRIAGTSPDLAGAATQHYQILMDQAVKVANVADYQDADGVYAIEFTLDVVYDASWGKALEVAIYNKLTALT